MTTQTREAVKQGMDTETGYYHLTAHDIKALRRCNRVIYRYNCGDSAGTDATSRLEAIKDASDDNPWEQRRHVDVDSRPQCFPYDHRMTRATVHMYLSLYDASPLRTFLEFLKPGDRLIALPIAGNDNGYLTAAGVHHDELRMEVVRGERGERRYRFNLEHSFGPDGYGRMCQTVARD